MQQVAIQDVLKVHHLQQLPDGSQRISKVTPYIILGNGDGRIWLKAGKVIDDNGIIVDDPPWLAEELSKMSVETLSDIGFSDRVPSRDSSTKKGK